MTITQVFFDLMIGFCVKGRFRRKLFGVLKRVYYFLPKGTNATIDYDLKGVRFSLNANHRIPLMWKNSSQ